MRVNKEQNKTNKNELLTTNKAVAEPPALAVQRETTMGGESVDSVISSNVTKPKQFEKVSGARKVWGTMHEGDHSQSCDGSYVQIVLTNLCETWLGPDIEDKELSINGYRTIRLDRNRHGGE